jgi:adenylate kinase family enzyme
MEETKALYYKNDYDSDIKIIVETVRVEGHGVILLTGPSSCGKGEIAKALCKFLSIPKERHLSMGEILRRTIIKAREDASFKDKLSEEYSICYKNSILDVNKNKAETIKKVESYIHELEEFFDKPINEISQLDWLEFCVNKGLLIPDEWTEQIMDAAMESSTELHKGIFILDGYPRTVTAAKKLLKTFEKAEIPIIKVLHLSITKHEMMNRALNRKRNDDTAESLERRYNFYVDKVQPSIDYLKVKLGVNRVALIDAHQPIFNLDRTLNVDVSIHNVVLSAIQSLGLPSYLLDLNIDNS